MHAISTLQIINSRFRLLVSRDLHQITRDSPSPAAATPSMEGDVPEAEAEGSTD